MKKIILLFVLILVNNFIIYGQSPYEESLLEMYPHHFKKDSVKEKSIIYLNDPKQYLIFNKIHIDHDGVGGLEPKITFINNSNKVIKYVYINVSFKNAVNDKIYCNISGNSNFSIKITGPIEPKEQYTGAWYAICYNSSGNTMIINSVKIIYMDNSQTILNKRYCNTISKYQIGDKVKSKVSGFTGRIYSIYLERLENNKYVNHYFVIHITNGESCYEEELEYVK